MTEPKRPVLGVLPKAGGLAATQAIHATLMLTLPLLATIIAAARAIPIGVHGWHIVLLGSMYFATMVGVTIGLHRLLSHRSFDPKPALSSALIALGSMAAQGPPIYWASNHRRHHAYTDSQGDLHSPHIDGTTHLSRLMGLWHAHVGWTFSHALTSSTVFGKDLLQNRSLLRLNQSYPIWVLLGLLIPMLIGWFVERSIGGAVDGLLWGGGVRIFLTYHLIAAVNSIGHSYGYRRYNTPDNSKNNVLLAIPTLGEGWHNNHHAFPNRAKMGRVWWEPDVGGLLIALFIRLGWANELKTSTRSARVGGAVQPTRGTSFEGQE